MEYKFTFYDVDTGVLRNVVGLVMNVWNDQIKIKYIPGSSSDTVNCSACKMKFTCEKSKNNKENIYGAEAPMPTCECILNPPTSLDKYNDPIVFFIAIENLVNVVYVKTNGNNTSNDEKWRTKVMLLGITATTVKAIIVRLGFIDDSLEDAIKYVDLQVGGIYNIVYEVKEGCTTTVYENRVKIVSIDEIPERPIHSTKNYVREEVGMHGSVYTCCCSDKDKFMTGKPVRPIKITVDTSELFEGIYETIMLDSIRDCTLIESGDNVEDQIPDGSETTNPCSCCQHKTENCKPINCGHYHHHRPLPPPEFRPNIFDFGEDGKVYLDPNGEISYHHNGTKTNASMEEMIKFFFGIN